MIGNNDIWSIDQQPDVVFLGVWRQDLWVPLRHFLLRVLQGLLQENRAGSCPRNLQCGQESWIAWTIVNYAMKLLKLGLCPTHLDRLNNVQNKKNYVCLRGAQCPVAIATRKKCPACRFFLIIILIIIVDDHHYIIRSFISFSSNCHHHYPHLCHHKFSQNCHNHHEIESFISYYLFIMKEPCVVNWIIFHCRFEKCLKMGMKLEAIREDRTRGGRSTYQVLSSEIVFIYCHFFCLFLTL